MCLSGFACAFLVFMLHSEQLKVAAEADCVAMEKAQQKAHEEELKRREQELEERLRKLDEDNARIELERENFERKAKEMKEKDPIKHETKSPAAAHVVTIAFGDLEFGEELGAGGFGTVWLGKWKSMGDEPVRTFFSRVLK